jgi:multidrug resistance efflux pump
MRMRSFGLVLTVAGALAVLSACETPTMENFNTLESRVTSLEAQVSAAEARANEAAAAADQCQQVCERADRMFQQNLRK